MRAWLAVCAALALACPRAADTALSNQTLEHIKAQILAKLGLSSRPMSLRAPPRDVVRQILARAADPTPPAHAQEPEQTIREIIAIAHRDSDRTGLLFAIALFFLLTIRYYKEHIKWRDTKTLKLKTPSKTVCQFSNSRLV